MDDAASFQTQGIASNAREHHVLFSLVLRNDMKTVAACRLLLIM